MAAQVHSYGTTETETARGRVLVVDDERPLRGAFERILTAGGYQCRTAASVAEARVVLDEWPADLVLTDVRMPGEDGIALLRHVHQHQPATPVILLTGFAEQDAEADVVRYGASGYLSKPCPPNTVLVNVAAAIGRRDRVAQTLARADALEITVAQRERELDEALDAVTQAAGALHRSEEETVDRLAIAAEWRDGWTGAHLRTMSLRTARLAMLLGHDEEFVEAVRVASKLHDIGKVGLPDAVLLSKNVYTPEERAIMQQHSVMGARMLEESASPLIRLGAQIAVAHHEWWNGSGYPYGISGSAIPEPARIAAVADVFDALRSERPYKTAFELERSVDTMRALRAVQFDPEILDVFLADIADNGDVVLPS